MPGKWKKHPWRFFSGIKSVLFLVVVGLGISLHIYTQGIIGGLRREARSLVSFYARMYARLAETETSGDISFLFEEIILKTDFPLINTDTAKVPVWWKGIEVDPDDRSEEALAKVRNLVERLDKEIDPVPIRDRDILLGYLYFSDSHLIQQLHWMPYIEIGIVGIFVIVGFIGYANLKRSEQRFIWVGMAKETAHQLGTPLSSLMGWLELLRENRGDGEKGRVYNEMDRDLKRLEQVTKRFSQIGSRPDLKRLDPVPILEDVVEYIRLRVPRKGRSVAVVGDFVPVPPLMLNSELFHWALENILKNSLDAMDKEQGEIRVSTVLCRDHNTVAVEIADNGRGIDPNNRKRIFKPGFSTKKRGWGLGLSLAKRIIEEYHGGVLSLKTSRVGQGTIIRIELNG
ncbi:HAMP domain-containing histidine kinase [bacterium]|nr:HAMP domain-containing histidine kinase [bacterium]